MSETIYSQIAAIAAPVVKYYHDDIRKHDFAALTRFQVGDVALWACYNCGSHLVHLSFSENMTIADRLKAAQTARDWFNACNRTWPQLRDSWHLLESTRGRHGTVRPITELEARSIISAKIADLEPRKPGGEFYAAA